MRRDDERLIAVPSGAAMDRVAVPNPWPRRARYLAGAVVLALTLFGLWRFIPGGLTIDRSELTLSTVRSGKFHDVLANRATVVPMTSFYLDATEGGRVEAVFTRDGETVLRGAPLLRLSNPQREQEMLARSADVAQQLANLSTQRAALAASRGTSRREIAALEYDLERQIKTHSRNSQLAAQGFISAEALEESTDRLRQQRRLVEQTQTDTQDELRTREQSIKQMEGAIAGLQRGLGVLNALAEGLSMRAPAAGVVTGFQLQQGESVKPGDRLGRIDTPDKFKLSASIDEFYLGRFNPGMKASVELSGKRYGLVVSRITPQVKDGRFIAELEFDPPTPVGLQPGQGLDTQIAMGESKEALIIENGGFFPDSGGLWVFVLDADGASAERRTVRLGRRSAGQIEVLEGLRPGERIIVSGYKRFGDAQQFRLR